MSKKINWFLINENYGANLCPFVFHFDADYHGFKKILGMGCNYQSVGIFNGLLRQGYGLDDYNKLAGMIFDRLANDKKFSKQMLKKIYQIVDEFYKFSNEILNSDLSKLNNQQLASRFEKFYKIFYAMSTWSVPFAFTEYGTPLWTNYLTDYLNNLINKTKFNSLEIYQILITNRNKTYTAKEKENILKLAIEVKRSKKLKKIFKLSSDRIARELYLADKKFLNKIKKHQKKYCWINFGFEGPLQDIEYFITSIKDWVVNKNPKEELNFEIKQSKIIYHKQKDLIQKLKIDQYHQWMFWVVREFSFQKAFRKDIEYFSYYAYDTMLKEFGRRFNITVKQGHFLLKDEIIRILSGQTKINTNKLNERIKACFYVVSNGKAKLLVGKKAINFNKNIKSRKVPKDLKELNGQCACHGQVKASVKIIKNKDDYTKFKTGDILVSYATNPNMVPLMKRASAIITDEGGVTCHAAIVSRELNIPCVIGTRFATSILKDGQKVEVDATKGVIKI